MSATGERWEQGDFVAGHYQGGAGGLAKIYRNQGAGRDSSPPRKRSYPFQDMFRGMHPFGWEVDLLPTHEFGVPRKEQNANGRGWGTLGGHGSRSMPGTRKPCKHPRVCGTA